MVQLLGDNAGLGFADLIVLAGYFVLVFLFGLLVGITLLNTVVIALNL